MSDSSQRPDFPVRLVEWFKTLVRPVVQATDPAAVADLDKQAAHLQALQDTGSKFFPVCLIGQAGVGKSTLINTLIADADVVVPSGGGTGPLTASAIVVSHGAQASFEVRYHSKQKLNETRFILESEAQRQAQPGSIEIVVDSADQEEASARVEDTEEEKRSRISDAAGRARLLVAGDQSAARDPSYLIDALRMVLGQASKFQTAILPEDQARLIGIREALQFSISDRSRRFDAVDSKDFRHRLREHACGYLAPMILEMSIRWPSQLLEGSLQLVDLPGIGILNDAYASITTEYLRHRAKAVMLVVDKRGIRREDAELLRSSGFLNRLLHSGEDVEADPVALVVAALHIDALAEENWLNDKSLHGKPQKSKVEHFSDQVDRSRNQIMGQLRTFLPDVWNDDSEGKRHVIKSILDNLLIFPVSAPQYRGHCDPDDNRPFLPTAEATNIPALRAALAELAERAVRERRERTEDAANRFFGQLRARIDLLSAQRTEERRAEAEIEAFRLDLEKFMQPHQREFDTRRGGFRTFLRKTIPIQIEAKVESASSVGRKGIHGELRKLRDTHWKTLQAAVRKDGTFDGSRRINLPKDFALKFEEPIAEVWSRDILVSVRKETREFADYQSAAVTEVLEWARSQGVRVSTRVLEAVVESVRQHQRQVNAVGRDAVDDLRDKVRVELIKKIEDPIRRKCQKFVAANKNEGTGVKSRILELFEELAQIVVDTAAVPARELLVERFREVDKEILEAFGDRSEPLSEAADALMQRQEKKSQREDAALASDIESALAASPEIG